MLQIRGLQSERGTSEAPERMLLVQEAINMPRFRVVATVTCPKPLARMIPMKLRKEARRLKQLGFSLDDVKVEEL